MSVFDQNQSGGQDKIGGQRDKSKIAVFFIDLDGFKGINDKYGHHVGDRVLQTTARRLTALVRESDTVARLGGDEFVVMFREFEGDRAAAQLLSMQG